MKTKIMGIELEVTILETVNNPKYPPHYLVSTTLPNGKKRLGLVECSKVY